MAVLLLLVALGFGLSGLGHDHSEADLSGDDHCTACHFQLSTLLPDPVAQIAVLATPRGNATQIDLFPYASASFRLGPPRRGPPAQLPTA